MSTVVGGGMSATGFSVAMTTGCSSIGSSTTEGAIHCGCLGRVCPTPTIGDASIIGASTPESCIGDSMSKSSSWIGAALRRTSCKGCEISIFAPLFADSTDSKCNPSDPRSVPFTSVMGTDPIVASAMGTDPSCRDVAVGTGPIVVVGGVGTVPVATLGTDPSTGA